MSAIDSGYWFGCCPLCGGEIAHEIEWRPDARCLLGRGRAHIFPKNPARLFDCLWRRTQQGHMVTTAEIMGHIYYDYPDGGPLDYKIVQVYISQHIRRQIRPFGLSVFGALGAKSGGYLLQFDRAETNERNKADPVQNPLGAHG